MKNQFKKMKPRRDLMGLSDGRTERHLSKHEPEGTKKKKCQIFRVGIVYFLILQTDGFTLPISS